MTIQELGSLGEFVGSIAVVITLIYLTTQLRQNTKAIRSASVQALDSMLSENFSSWSSSPENAVVMSQGTQDYESLDDDKKIQFGYMMTRFFLNMDSAYWAYINGNLPEEIWNRQSAAIKEFLNSQGGEIGWRHSHVTNRFRDYVETNIRTKNESA